MSDRKSNKKIIIAVSIVLAILIAGSALIYHFFGPNTQQGLKEIAVEIVFAQGDAKTVEIKTDAEYLRGALEEEDLVEGDESEYGLFITAVDGVAADTTKQQWWCITKGGETVMTGIDSTPIQDGDKFEITLKTGYDF